VSTKKQSQRIFSITLFRSDDFIKFRGLIPESTQDTTPVAFPTKPVKPYVELLF